MKLRTILALVSLGLVIASYSQKPTLELTFTAIDSATHVQLDSIKVMNRSQGGDTVLYYPDTVLVLDYITGVEDVYGHDNGLKVYQNYPNPAVGSTTITIFVPEKEEVQCIVVDIMGRKLIRQKQELAPGYHSFSYTPGDGDISFFTVQTKDSRETIKILHSKGQGNRIPSLKYLGRGQDISIPYKSLKATQNFSFSLGDTLLYIGYVDEMESGMLDAPMVSDTFYFQFATNIPCPGTPTVTYEGQVYNTIQIFSQCWMKENLNVGIMIQGNQNMTNNGIIEKYCYYNKIDSCTKYGGLYQWKEMMQYSSTQGTQGICPLGWHIPTDEEWNVLEGAVDSQFGIGNTIWTNYGYGYRGYDVGTNLKTAGGWINQGNGDDLFSYSGLPGGFVGWTGSFNMIGEFGYWWTSTKFLDIYALDHRLGYDSPKGFRVWDVLETSFSVRCIKN